MATTTMANAAPPTSTTPIPPNQSLYLQNLPEKLQKDDLRRALYMLFSTYGPVLDVTALKTAKMRGQAHLLFRDVPSATQAMRACQGTDFFGREMRISYSRHRSNTLAKLTGTFHPTATAVESANPAAQAAAPPLSFPAPPGTTQAAPPASSTTRPPPPGLPTKLKAPAAPVEDAPSPLGVKRARGESDAPATKRQKDEAGSAEEEEDEDVEMEVEEEEEDEGAMEMSDED